MWISAPLLISLALSAPPDLSALTPNQRKVFNEVAAEEFCSCSSALTLAGCFEMRPSCTLAQDLGRVIMRGVQGTNVSASDLLGFLSQRVMGPFCSDPHTFNTAGAPSLGNENAPITVVEFADFRCGHCRTAAPVVKEAFKRNQKDVRVVFMPFPLSNHPQSVAAAEAALAAQAQGKFWEMHDALFNNQERGFEQSELLRLARRVGLDVKRFEADLASQKHRAQVMKLKQQGLDAGIEGTPSIFINGRRYELDTVLYTMDERFSMERHRNAGNCQ